MHQENNYPFEKPPGDLDVNLPDGCADDLYLRLLRENLRKALPAFRPELIYYLAGADPYREDQLGGLGLTLEGLRERDRIVFTMAREHNVPVAVTFAGGYARNVEDTIAIHVGTVREASLSQAK
jgi:acetoin utilization deacetylase AcuC-like enzyme